MLIRSALPSALDNGVSAGLATIRRDLVALNGVVEGSATRLKHLTRAAADLQVGPGVAEPIDKGSTAPARKNCGGSIPIPSDPQRLDPGLFAPSHTDLHHAAEALLPIYSPPAAQSITDVGPIPANRLTSMLFDPTAQPIAGAGTVLANGPSVSIAGRPVTVARCYERRAGLELQVGRERAIGSRHLSLQFCANSLSSANSTCDAGSCYALGWIGRGPFYKARRCVAANGYYCLALSSVITK